MHLLSKFTSRLRKMGLIGMMLINSCILFAQEDYSDIRIGLISLYQNAQEVKISSANHINFGYMIEDHFIDIGDIYTSYVTIKPSIKDYYTDDIEYTDYQEASLMADFLGEGSIVAHVGQGIFKIYSTYQYADSRKLPMSISRIDILDEAGNIILVSENNYCPIVFQGVDYGTDFPVTGVGSREYRGVVEIVRNSKGLTPVNILPLEEYLYGVVPAEMVSSWPQEALKAQAVAARSLAITQFNRNVDNGYNLVDTVQNQVYKGIDIEQLSTNLAVDQTSGIVAKYNDMVAETLFFSTSGGYTEDPQYVWGGEYPYLRAVEDSFEVDPETKPWTRTITLEEIEQCLSRKGWDIGTALGVEIVSRTPSGRVNELKILGTTDDKSIFKEDIRTFFSASNEGSLKSRLFSFEEDIHRDKESASTIFVENNQGVLDYSYEDLLALSVESENGVFEFGGELFVESPIGIVALKELERPVQTLREREIVFGDVTIYGKGFGHGVGMSQSGAKGMAAAGYSFDEILKYYYHGVEIEKY